MKRGDTISIIALSRPIYDYKKKIGLGIKALKQMGFKKTTGVRFLNGLKFQPMRKVLEL